MCLPVAVVDLRRAGQRTVLGLVAVPRARPFIRGRGSETPSTYPLTAMAVPSPLSTLIDTGRRRIAHLTGPQRARAVAERVKGVQATLGRQRRTLVCPVRYGRWSQRRVGGGVRTHECTLVIRGSTPAPPA